MGWRARTTWTTRYYTYVDANCKFSQIGCMTTKLICDVRLLSLCTYVGRYIESSEEKGKSKRGEEEGGDGGGGGGGGGG